MDIQPPLAFTKRRKFVISTLFLSGLLLGAIVTNGDWRPRFIGAMALTSFIATAWNLGDNFKGVSRLFTTIFSLMYLSSAGMFTFLLPQQITEFWIFPLSSSWGTSLAWGVKGLFWVLFTLGLYSLFLTENIFAVSTIRTIQLARAANVVGFLLILVVAFFSFDTLLSFRLPYYWNFLGIGLISLPLFLVGLWSVKLEDHLKLSLLTACLVLSFVTAQIAGVLSFWPVSITVGSLALTTVMYVLLGLYQQELTKRLFKKTVWEYTGVGIIVFLIIWFTTRWGN